jgi:hypothetical protein
VSNYKIYNNIKDVNNIEEIKSRKSHDIWCPFYDREQIIEFLDNYLMVTINYLDYEDWKLLIKMYKWDLDKISLWTEMWIIKNRMYSNKIRTHWHRDNSDHTAEVYQINSDDFVNKLKSLIN